MKLRTYLLVLLFLFVGQSVAFSQDTYYLTEEQLNELTEQINNLQNNNKSMKSLLQLQQNDYEILQQSYQEQLQTTNKQQQNYQELLSRLESRNSIYKYALIVVGVLAFSLGVVVAK